MADATATVQNRNRISAIWLVPIVALILGVWMVIYSILRQGPEVTILFSTAEGIVAGETKIKTLNVDVGLVESVALDEFLEKVVVTAQLDANARPLLRDDTQFWVVRPRIGAGGISGLGTLLSGGYIQLAPGSGEEGARVFSGLEDPPITPAGTPGLQLELVSDRAGSVGTGDPILYKGYRVGRIESAKFDVETQQMQYRAFIDAPYDDLVSSATRFWNASGFQLSASAEGIEATTASLETLLIGGVAMGLPTGMDPGEPVDPGARFDLYTDFASVNQRPHKFGMEYVVHFPQSVRGLEPGAPVEYRGIAAGRVERILLEELAAESFAARGGGAPIPVLVRIEPGALRLPDSEEGVEALQTVIENAVGNGMRASLATGNLLTGRLYISLDMYPDDGPQPLGVFAGRPTLPTIPSGLAGIEQKLATLLDNVNSLPLDNTVRSATRTLDQLAALLSSPEVRSLPGNLDATLVELREAIDALAGDAGLQGDLVGTVAELDRTLVSVRQLLDTLETQPNALIFNRQVEADPRPPVGR